MDAAKYLRIRPAGAQAVVLQARSLGGHFQLGPDL